MGKTRLETFYFFALLLADFEKNIRDLKYKVSCCS